MQSYVSRNLSTLSGGRSLKELKNLEWIFIGIHMLGIPTAIAMIFLHKPSSLTVVSIAAALLAVWCVIAITLNYRIASVEGQVRLGLATQIVIMLFAWALVFEVVSGKNTAAYAGFFVVIIEGAMRFGLRGSLFMGIVFALGLIGAMFYRDWHYGLNFDPPGYAFWTVLSFIIALSVGLVTEENRRQRERSERLVKERTLMEERNRIARDLHDTVLKTLHGLALEAHALKKQASSPAIREKSDYIEGVCQRSTQEIREMISELRSESSDEGIASIMSRMMDSWSKATGIKAELTISGSDQPLSLLASHNLRNVLSEALLNVQKHAAASQVSVLLELLPGEIRLEIADNGKGISYAGDEIYTVVSQGKFGILGMKERVEQLNGQFSIDGRQGTRLLISVPLVSAR